MTRPSQSMQLVLVVVALVAAAAGAYLFVIGPKRASTADLAQQVALTQTQIDAARVRAAAPTAPIQAAVDAAELFRLTKAMPDRAEMAQVILGLNQIATDTGIALESITPGAPETGSGYQVLPIALTFEGDFYNLSDFLFRLRNLVAVRDGKLSADGRLFNVSTISFGAATAGFPQLAANVTVDAYVFGASAAPETGQAAPPATDEAAPTAAPAGGEAS